MAAPAPLHAFSLRESEGIAELVFDLPGEKLNILRAAVMEELAGVVSELSNRTDVTCLVVRSGKPGIFIAGADIKEISAIREPREAEEKSRSGQELFNSLEDLPFPTVAVIDGAAMGGGLELALACTYRLVSDNPKTQLGLPETGLGIVPGFGGTYRLPRTVGLAHALRMILSGKPVDGPRAAKMGLAHACYPAAFLADKARTFAREVASGKLPPRRRKRGAFNALGRALVFRTARRDVLAKGGRHYPALLEVLSLLKKTARASRQKALLLERQALGRTATSSVCRNLIGVYFAREAARRVPGAAAAATGAARAPGAAQAPGASTVSRAAVIGAGVMGGKIAWLFAHHDIPAVMKDVNWDAVQRGFASAYQTYKDLARRGRLDSRTINLGMHKLTGAVEYASLGRPDFAVEAVVEDMSIKKKVLAEVEREVAPDAVLASNTSSLSITEMAGALDRPERFVGMHFFNPPSIMPLVEIIPGARTGPEAVARASRLALDLGKTPVVVKDCPGFLVNRLLVPYLNESVALVEEGADFRTVDRALEEFGMPMGPFVLLDEIGLDVAAHVARILVGAFADRIAPAVLLGNVAGTRGFLGKKSGKGFYVHEKRAKAGAKPRPNPEIWQLLPRPANTKTVSRLDMLHRPLLAMLNEAARALEEGVVASARDLDLALVLGTGFPPFRGGLLRWAEDELGLPTARDMLELYARTVGKRFTPAPLINTLAAQSKTFSQGAAA